MWSCWTISSAGSSVETSTVFSLGSDIHIHKSLRDRTKCVRCRQICGQTSLYCNLLLQKTFSLSISYVQGALIIKQPSFPLLSRWPVHQITKTFGWIILRTRPSSPQQPDSTHPNQVIIYNHFLFYLSPCGLCVSHTDSKEEACLTIHSNRETSLWRRSEFSSYTYLLLPTC